MRTTQPDLKSLLILLWLSVSEISLLPVFFHPSLSPVRITQPDLKSLLILLWLSVSEISLLPVSFHPLRHLQQQLNANNWEPTDSRTFAVRAAWQPGRGAMLCPLRDGDHAWCHCLFSAIGGHHFSTCGRALHVFSAVILNRGGCATVCNRVDAKMKNVWFHQHGDYFKLGRCVKQDT